jgi:hypothetical protein
VLTTLAIIATVIPTPISGQAIEIHINIPSEAKQTAIIRGFWHNLSIPNNSDTIAVKLTRGAAIQNETNHYAWSYKNSQWYDELYQNSYIDATNCLRTGSSTIFRLGVDVTADLGVWQVEITASGSIIHAGVINVISPVRDLSLSAPDYFFIAEEASQNWIPPVSNQYFWLRNIGNVPFGIPTFSFSDKNGIIRDSNFKLTNASIPLHVDGDSTHYLSFRGDESFQAQTYMPVDCMIQAKSAYVIPTTTSHVLESILAHKFTMILYIKNQGDYFVDANSFLIYEYKNTIDVRPGENFQHDLFITALKKTDVTVGVTSVNFEISQVRILEQVKTAPLTISMNASETSHIIIDAIAYDENATGKFIYGITPASGTTELLEVEVSIGFKLPPQERLWFFGLAFAIISIMIIFGTLSVFMKRKREKEIEMQKSTKEGKKLKRNR